MKIGVSLAMDVLCGVPSNDAQRALMRNRNVHELLSDMKDMGVYSVEMRTVNPSETKERISAAADAIVGAGLVITVHGVMREERPELFYEQLVPIVERQRDVNVTIHPVVDNLAPEENTAATVRALKGLRENIEPRFGGVRLALENCRMKKKPDFSVNEAGVMEALDAVGDAGIGACWDFGHMHSDRLNYPELLPSPLPDRRFAERAVHTHIHDICGRTHFPLGTGNVPVKDTIDFLRSAGYKGIFNLELEPERWVDVYPDVWEQYVRSVGIIQSFA